MPNDFYVFKLLGLDAGEDCLKSLETPQKSSGPILELATMSQADYDKSMKDNGISRKTRREVQAAEATKRRGLTEDDPDIIFMNSMMTMSSKNSLQLSWLAAKESRESEIKKIEVQIKCHRRLGTLTEVLSQELHQKLLELVQAPAQSWEEYEKANWKAPTPLKVAKQKNQDVATPSSASKPQELVDELNVEVTRDAAMDAIEDVEVTSDRVGLVFSRII